MAHALGDRLVVAVLAFVFEKAGDLAHFALYFGTLCFIPPRSAAAFISLSARRYSTGMTLRNFGYQVFHSARILAATARTGEARVARDQVMQPMRVEPAHVGHDVDQAVRFEIAGVVEDRVR